MSFFVAKKIHCTFVYALHWMPRYTYAIRMSCEKVNATLHDTILKALRLRECVYLGSGASKWRKHKCLWLDSFSAPSELSENGFCKLFYVIIHWIYTHTLHCCFLSSIGMPDICIIVSVWFLFFLPIPLATHSWFQFRNAILLWKRVHFSFNLWHKFVPNQDWMIHLIKIQVDSM